MPACKGRPKPFPLRNSNWADTAYRASCSLRSGPGRLWDNEPGVNWERPSLLLMSLGRARRPPWQLRAGLCPSPEPSQPSRSRCSLSHCLCCIYFLVQAVTRNQIISILQIRSPATPARVYIYCYVTLCTAPTNAIYGYHRTHPIHYFHWLRLYPSLCILSITFPALALFMGLVCILHIPAIMSAHIHHFIQIYDPRITFVPKKLFKKFL